LVPGTYFGEEELINT